MNVSRETQERLDSYLADLLKWTPSINLVAQCTIEEARHRHIADSVQVIGVVEGAFRRWCDLGSGGGLPGIVAAILAQESEPEAQFFLIESDQRKAAFLKLQVKKLGLQAQVISQRIEESDPCDADIVSARAVAPLKILLSYARRHLNESGMAIFLKGRSYQDEIEIARETWHFDLECRPSKTDSEACLLIVRNLRALERQS